MEIEKKNYNKIKLMWFEKKKIWNRKLWQNINDVNKKNIKKKTMWSY